MIVTNHAEERMKERCGLPKKSINRMAQKALEEGVSHSDTCGALHRFISKLYYYNKTANNIKLYGNHAFIFHGTTLITVLEIPHRFRGMKHLKTKGCKYE